MGVGFENLAGFLGDPPTKSPLFFLVFRNGSYQTDFLPKLSTQCTMDITDALIFSHGAAGNAACIVHWVESLGKKSVW